MKFWPRGNNPHDYGTRLKTRMALLWLALFGGALGLLLVWLGILSFISSANSADICRTVLQ